MSKRYLIDTNIFLWHLENDPRLPMRFAEIIGDSFIEIWISIASLWEITIKSSRGGLEQIGDFDDFITRKFRATGFRILPIRMSHLQTLRTLPFHHRDPFDRLIIAQSFAEDLKLLYTDDAFSPYYSQEPEA